MKYEVLIHDKNGKRTMLAEKGTNLLELLVRSGIPMNTPCGGKGICGKCAVKVEGFREEVTDSEKRLLGMDRIGKGFRLACQVTVSSRLDVYPDAAETEASIVIGGKRRSIQVEPIIAKRCVELEPPSLENQASYLKRVLDSQGQEFEKGNARLQNLPLLQELPSILKESNYKVTLVSIDGRLAAVEPGDSTGSFFGMAFDIGTTTVAAYLYDLGTGRQAAAGSMLNPQRKHGADVISRINYASEAREKGIELQRLITACINELMERLALVAGISTSAVYSAVFAGNTTMLHLLLGLDTADIAVSPFIPVTTALTYFSPAELGLNMNKSGIGVVFPGVSAYVGGDTVAAILSSGMYEKDEISLLVDIGTNGEIVLGGAKWLLACSTAAGPAFEGANIRNGMGSVIGAINSVGPGPGFEFTTIGNAKPIGICGSGIIDVTARLLDAGIVDETGRMAGGDEAGKFEHGIGKRLITIDGERAFLLAAGKDSPIAVTQEDIREIQNAKAAIAAGIETLMGEAGISLDDIKKVYLAGGFGSNIKIDSAVKTGLLPGALKDRMEAIGNASGSGASEGLLSRDMLRLAESIAQRVKYVELSASASFTEKYVNNMLF
ncbi:MAG: ASKHA domain-containing protein [Bacillota bacterium]